MAATWDASERTGLEWLRAGPAGAWQMRVAWLESTGRAAASINVGDGHQLHPLWDRLLEHPTLPTLARINTANPCTASGSIPMYTAHPVRQGRGFVKLRRHRVVAATVLDRVQHCACERHIQRQMLGAHTRPHPSPPRQLPIPEMSKPSSWARARTRSTSEVGGNGTRKRMKRPDALVKFSRVRQPFGVGMVGGPPLTSAQS